MTTWPRKTIGALCDVTAGGTPSRAHPEFFGGGIPWVKIGDMLQGCVASTDETISPAALTNSSAKLLPPGTVLISIFATIGRTAVLGVEAATNQAIAGLTPRDPTVLSPGYLRLYLDYIAPSFEKRARGVAQGNINSTILRSTEIPVPPLTEQRRIAAILDQADALRAKRRAAIAQLDTLAQSIFLDMFGAARWPQTELRDAVRAGTIVTYGIVQAGPEVPEGVPYIRTGDIVAGEIACASLRHTAREIAARFERSRVRTGDIVMSIRATVGTTAKVPPELDGANLTQGTARISPGGGFDGTFLLYLLRSPPIQRWISQQIKGATFREITLKRLRELPVIHPPLALQRQFACRVEKIESLKCKQHTSLAQLDALFSSLQYRVFRGEL